MKTNKFNLLMIVLGFMLTVGTFCVVEFTTIFDGLLIVFPFVLLVISFQVIGRFTVRLIINNTTKGNEKSIEEFEIEELDERNVKIRNMAGSEAYNMSMFLYSPLLVISVLMDIETIFSVMLLCVILFLQFYWMFAFNKYQKKM